MIRSVQTHSRLVGSRAHSQRNWRRMASRKRPEIRTLLSPSTRARNRRHRSKAPVALVPVLAQALVALGSDGDLVGVMAFPLVRAGAGAMDPTSELPITLKAALWPTLLTREPMILCGAV